MVDLWSARMLKQRTTDDKNFEAFLPAVCTLHLPIHRPLWLLPSMAVLTLGPLPRPSTSQEILKWRKISDSTIGPQASWHLENPRHLPSYQTYQTYLLAPCRLPHLHRLFVRNHLPHLHGSVQRVRLDDRSALKQWHGNPIYSIRRAFVVLGSLQANVLHPEHTNQLQTLRELYGQRCDNSLLRNFYRRNQRKRSYSESDKDAHPNNHERKGDHPGDNQTDQHKKQKRSSRSLSDSDLIGHDGPFRTAAQTVTQEWRLGSSATAEDGDWLLGRIATAEDTANVQHWLLSIS